MIEVHFILLTAWTFAGEPIALRSAPIYGPREVCMKRLPLDIAVQKQSFAAVSGECVATPEKPANLQEKVQPHVPAKVDA